MDSLHLEVRGMTWLLVEHDMNDLLFETELEMTWIVCIKRLEASGINVQLDFIEHG